MTRKLRTLSRALEEDGGKLFGTKYPEPVRKAWHRVHGNKSHMMDVDKGFVSCFPDQLQNLSREEKEMMLKQTINNWACVCPGAAEVVTLARKSRCPSYYL